jgi:hypothetical protein
LRQWVLEEVIVKFEAGAESGRSVLAKAMQVRLFCPDLSLVTGFKPGVLPPPDGM